MYKLLIVEDERSTREGLRDCVNWDSYNIAVVGEAANGQEALSFLLENPVDIVLTDVVMPLMDGIELVRQIRERNIDTKVVFVSGYWDMAYLKSAFKLDAIDYILKPVKLSELEKVIQKITDICRREMEEKIKVQKMRDKLEASMPLLREKFVAELLTGTFQKKDAIEQRILFLDIPFAADGYYTVITLQASQNVETNIAEKIEEYEIRRMIIKDVIESTLLETCYNSFCLTMNGNDTRIIVILHSRHSILYDEIISIAQRMQRNIHAFLDIPISIGIGEEVQNIEFLKISYNKSLRALEQEYFLGEGQIIHYKDIDFRSDVLDYFLHYYTLEKLLNAVRLGNKREVKSIVNQIFKDIESCSGMNIDHIQTICFEIIVLIEKFLLKSYNISLNIGQKKSLWNKILKLKTLKHTEEWLASQLCKLAQQVADIQNKRSKGIIGEIKKFIEEHYSENITVQTLAEEFYLTPNYISMLFKKETGENFKDYLTKIRIDKAKALIQDPLFKLYQVAESVGYKDPDYFTKVFKKYTGVTPSEYRERLN